MSRERLISLSLSLSHQAAAGMLTELRLPVTPRSSTVNGGSAKHDWPTLRFGSRRVRVDPGFPSSVFAGLGFPDTEERNYSYLHVPVGSGSWKGCVYRVRSRIEPGDVLVVKRRGRPRSMARILVCSVRPVKSGRASWVWVIAVRGI